MLLFTTLGGEIISISPIRTKTKNPHHHLGFKHFKKKKSDLEDLIRSYIISNERKWNDHEAFTKEQKVINKNIKASLRNLETQVEQLAHQFSGKTYGNLPSNTERNPRKKVNVIILRNERELEELEKKKLRERVKKDKKVMDETLKKDESESSKFVPTVKFALEVKTYKPKIPFPARLVQHNLDKQFSKFLEIFKKLHINIPFADALAQMPSYAKFLKEILKNKRKLKDFETVKLNEKCSAILLNKLP